MNLVRRLGAASWGDLAAGLTVAALVLPLGIGFAVTAGLPPAHGLYASMLPMLVFALAASSRITMIGPDASVTALMVASVVPLAASSGASMVDLAAALALVSGGVCLAAAAIGAGRLALLLDEASLVGYLAGLAVVVGAAQLPRLLGLSIDAGATTAVVVEVAREAARIDVWSALLGIGTIVLVVGARARRPALPWMLVAVSIAAVVTALANLDDRGVATVGALPSGLPPIGLPSLDLDAVVALLPIALAVAAVTFADTMATARAFAARQHVDHRPGRDLAALGFADLAAGISGGMPVSASGARTAAAEGAGGRTQLTGMVAAATVGAVLLGGGALLGTLPQPALAGVVIAAVVPLVDVQALGRLRRLDREEFREALLVAICVVAIGVLEGIVVAVAVSLVRRIPRR